VAAIKDNGYEFFEQLLENVSKMFRKYINNFTMAIH